MKTQLTLQERLKDLRIEHDLYLEELANLTGISKSALGNYESDDFKEINHGNLITLAKFYNVSTDYILGLTENRKHPNTDLNNLHLSDDMVDLLTSGKINNRLLCEIVTHDKFKEIMANIEIFVDGIATSTLKSFNAYIENLKSEIIGKYPDANGDYTLQTLDSSLINEGDFFCHKTHKTWDTILQDIRKNHEHDVGSVPDNESTIDFLSTSFKIMRSPGDNIDKSLTAILHFFKIDYMALPDEDRFALRKIIKKSSYSKNAGIKHRKKGKKK
ncbi:MAG: helix-turn-helix domain-containing protein [Treponema sp.]